MNKFAKTIVALMLSAVAVIVAGCSKPEAPNNGENDNVQNDSIVAHDDSLNVHDYVDLGLPSGTLWATCNLGADTPEGYGDYFAWGETAPKEAYDWNGYKYGNFANDRYEFNKYCTDSVYGLNGFVDKLTILEPADDAATANWGADWRTPTMEEWDELLQNTTFAKATQNGVKGWRLTASNGNSIFLPAVGYWWDGVFDFAGIGIYWSSSLNKEFPNRAWGFHLNSDSCHVCGSSDRSRGQTVRAVRVGH